MGGIIGFLKNNCTKDPSGSLFYKSISYIRNGFSAYKSLCENFYLTQTEFNCIFGDKDNLFVVWDKEKSGLIDSFELFAGLAMFSNSKVDDKIRFLFELFDLNDSNYLTFEDMEFMIYSVLNSSFKIFDLDFEIENDVLKEFLEEFFKAESIIKVVDLLKLKESKPVLEFLNLIESKNPQNPLLN